MFGWRRRTLFSDTSFFLPRGVRPEPGRQRLAGPLLCLPLTFMLATGLRLLELPFWDNPAWALGNEFLLATHDAYHWIAGAEGFEFGAGHPMSELLRLTAEFLDLTPAQAGFRLPPFMSGLLAVAVFLWGWGLGQPYAGMSAGILASLAPAFCARTLLGFYDTDLVVLLFAVLLGLVPALWLSPRLAGLPDVLVPRVMRHLERFACKALCPLPARGHRALQDVSALTAPWLTLLILSGLFGWQTQFWHSLFPYLIRYCALLPGALILLLGPVGARGMLLRGAVCHSLPLLAGLPGALAAAVYAALLLAGKKSGGGFPGSLAKSRILPALLWGVVIWLVLDSAIFESMLRSFASYADRSGHVGSGAPDPVVFPSVARSIIEIQTLSLTELLIYSYPLESIAAAACIAAVWRMLVTPAFLWLLPLLVLSALSLRMGARMTMFGPPVLMLALCMTGGGLLEAAFHILRVRLSGKRALRAHPAPGPRGAVEKAARPLTRPRPPARFAASLLCTAVLVWPMIRPLPEYVQGPVISREQAEGLAFLKNATPEDSLIWNWWDWGYATHHFSRRHTVADGARHGGPSLYLPAAVYTTADPRHARQIIKYTALKGNVPGKVFEGLSAAAAQNLMQELADEKKPLIKAEGRQYLVVSLDLVRLGLWVTRFGSWNFLTREGSGALLNTLASSLQFNPDTGEIISGDSGPVPAAGIAFFDSGGLEQHRYNRPGAYYFLFSLQKNERTGGKDGAIGRFWTWQRGRNPFPAAVSDKLAMDQTFFNSMMVQLLLRPENDPAIAPYFRLVFDNTYTRIYEVL